MKVEDTGSVGSTAELLEDSGSLRTTKDLSVGADGSVEALETGNGDGRPDENS